MSLFTAEDLAEILSTLAGGARSAAYDGKSVSYLSLDERLRLAEIMRADIAGTAPTPRSAVASFSKGFV